ncbi:MAG: archaetidylserine decarboxylase [Candidatus Latescibacteria bacterium]|nr:archaetidylserine decarboxylase [Candidatus Latescibacterota bacterium]
MPPDQTIEYRDRENGRIVQEPLLHDGAQRWIYRHAIVHWVLDRLVNNAAFCAYYGRSRSSFRSREGIADFVAEHGIDTDEFERPVDSYESFNAFFTRRLKPGARSFERDADVFCAPADGKVLVHPDLSAEPRIFVKGVQLSIASLLDSEDAARPFSEGSALVVRLAPYDYHRFHFPDSGRAGQARTVAGRYHVVNPIGLGRVPDAFLRNKRSITEIDSGGFGAIAYVEVGGFTVGSIVQTYEPGPVERGQEKGYFQYGGSTLVLLFQRGAVRFDDDLLRDSADGLEVHVKAATRLGQKG